MATRPNLEAAAAIGGAGTPPPVVPTEATIAPITAAGVDLVRRMMYMLAGSLVLLVALLLLSECSEQSGVSTLTEQQIAIITASQGQPADPRLATVAADLRHAAQDANWTMPALNVTAVKTLVDVATKNPALTEAQRVDLGKCFPAQPAAQAAAQPAAQATAQAADDRAAAITKCAAVLETVFGERSAAADRIGLFQALQKSLAEERAAYRSFWLQVAQLILINLLLPIITALLGYIFGTQQSNK